jgi:hypothetical protein
MKRLQMGSQWVKAGVSMMFATSLAGSAFAQTGRLVTTDAIAVAPPAALMTVDAQQKGPWTVGIDPTRNTVRLPNTATNPLPVTVVNPGADSGRRPFQARVFVNPTNEGVAVTTLTIPAGKRLIIEHVSAIARNQEGLRMEVNFFTYLDSNGDGVGDIMDITFHRLTMTEQGTFAGTAVATANHKMLVFADEQIGTGHFGVGARRGSAARRPHPARRRSPSPAISRIFLDLAAVPLRNRRGSLSSPWSRGGRGSWPGTARG